MEQVNPEATEQFQKNNGMSIEDAYQHVKTWYAEGKYSEVVDGCGEILQYIPDYKDVPEILKNAQAQIDSVNQSIPKESEPKPAQTENQTTNPQKVEKTEKKKKDEIYTGAVATDEKIISAIGYLGFLAILPLLLKRESNFCQFHGKQALVLAIIFFFYKYLAILDFLPIFGTLVKVILHLALIFELVIMIMGIIQAYRGKYWKIPVIYGMSQKLKF